MFPERNFSLTPSAKYIALSLAVPLFIVCAASAHATTYYACVSNSTGSIVIVSSTHTCSSTQHKISWNQTGPTGPKGATGPAGPQGPPGISKGVASFSPSHTNIGVQTIVLRTHGVPNQGTYYVNATALLNIDRLDTGAFCFLLKNGAGANDGNYGGSDLAGHTQQAAIADFFFLNVGDFIDLRCFSGSGDSRTYVENAGMTVTLIVGANDNDVLEKPAADPNYMPGQNPNSN